MTEDSAKGPKIVGKEKKSLGNSGERERAMGKGHFHVIPASECTL